MVNRSEALAKKVLDAARLSFKVNEPASDIAKKFGVSRSSISVARLIVEFGTEEQLEIVSSGQVGFRTMGDIIRKSLPPEVRAKVQGKAGVWTEARRQNQHSDSEIWQKLIGAISALKGLPKPEDVVRVVTKNGVRKITLENNLDAALNWIKDFEHEWNIFQRELSEKREQPQKDTSDTGDGSPIAEPQSIEQAVERPTRQKDS